MSKARRVLISIGLICLTANLLSESAKGVVPGKKIELPDYPEGAAYILSRLSNEELIQIERSEPVFVAIVAREGISSFIRKDAISKLSVIRKTDEATQILRAITEMDQKQDTSTDTLNELAVLLTSSTPQQLDDLRTLLVDLTTEGKLHRTRVIGYAGLVIVDNGIDDLWKPLQESNHGVEALLESIGLIPDANLHTAFLPMIKHLSNDLKHAELRKAGILASTRISGYESEASTNLISLIKKDVDRATAIQALLQLPSAYWPKKRISELADIILSYAVEFAPEERNTPEFKRTLQLGEEVAALVPEAPARDIRSQLGSLGIRIVTLRVIPQLLLYDKRHIVVEAGESVEITFENTGIMPHNLVIVAPNAMQEIGLKAAGMINHPEGRNGKKFVPDSRNVMVATRMLTAGEFGVLRFVAPMEVGDYPYLCTFPGHWFQMNGTMHVVRDINNWSAETKP